MSGRKRKKPMSKRNRSETKKILGNKKDPPKKKQEVLDFFSQSKRFKKKARRSNITKQLFAEWNRKKLKSNQVPERYQESYKRYLSQRSKPRDYHLNYITGEVVFIENVEKWKDRMSKKRNPPDYLDDWDRIQFGVRIADLTDCRKDIRSMKKDKVEIIEEEFDGKTYYTIVPPFVHRNAAETRKRMAAQGEKVDISPIITADEIPETEELECDKDYGDYGGLNPDKKTTLRLKCIKKRTLLKVDNVIYFRLEEDDELRKIEVGDRVIVSGLEFSDNTHKDHHYTFKANVVTLLRSVDLNKSYCYHFIDELMQEAIKNKKRKMDFPSQSPVYKEEGKVDFKKTPRGEKFVLFNMSMAMAWSERQPNPLAARAALMGCTMIQDFTVTKCLGTKKNMQWLLGLEADAIESHPEDPNLFRTVDLDIIGYGESSKGGRDSKRLGTCGIQDKIVFSNIFLNTVKRSDQANGMNDEDEEEEEEKEDKEVEFKGWPAIARVSLNWSRHKEMENNSPPETRNKYTETSEKSHAMSFQMERIYFDVPYHLKNHVGLPLNKQDVMYRMMAKEGDFDKIKRMKDRVPIVENKTKAVIGGEIYMVNTRVKSNIINKLYDEKAERKYGEFVNLGEFKIKITPFLVLPNDGWKFYLLPGGGKMTTKECHKFVSLEDEDGRITRRDEINDKRLYTLLDFKPGTEQDHETGLSKVVYAVWEKKNEQ